MARTIRNAGSAPIYRETENLMLLCIEMVERTPNSVGIRQLSKRLIDTLLDGLTVIGLALNEEDPDSKLELINSFYLQMRTVKTCIDTLKEWSNRSPHTRIISNKQMPHFAESLKEISNLKEENQEKINQLRKEINENKNKINIKSLLVRCERKFGIVISLSTVKTLSNYLTR